MTQTDPKNHTLPNSIFDTLLTAIPDHHIVVVGDVMLDKFIGGSVTRISPEAPIPILSMQSELSMPGGAGNVIRNLSSLGAKTTLIGVTGQDNERDMLLSHLQSQSHTTIHLHPCGDRPTAVKTRYVADNQQILRVDNEKPMPIDTQVEKTLLSAVQNALENAHAIILSDYGKGVLTETLITAIIQSAQAKNIPVLVDPKGNDYSKYKGATLLTPNRNELSQATGMPTQSDQHISEASHHLITTAHVGGILATRSEQGMSWITPDIAFHQPTTAMDITDVSGAGDTVIAAVACAMACGHAPETCVHFANTCAGIVVSKLGTAVVYPADIENRIQNESNPTNNHNPVSKIMSGSAVEQQSATWRTQGLNIGFTNGCFDILHTGHLSLIEQAKSACDRLILGLNSDASVKRLGKGDDRPINTEQSRAALLAALSHVDAVVIFHEDTPLNLINTIKPHTLIKGADYTIETVVGATEVQSWGGRVVLADLIDGQSTTGTIAKIRDNQ